MGRLIARLIAAQDGWATPLGEFNHRWLNAIFRPIRPLKDFLNGTWLGHPLHAAATDIPIGSLLLVVILDLLNQPAAADVALVATILFMLAAAVTGAGVCALWIVMYHQAVAKIPTVSATGTAATSRFLTMPL